MLWMWRRGDIFSFIMDMENQSFREVFLSLGGTYKEETFQDRIWGCRAVKEQEVRKKQRKAEEKKRRLNNDLIDIYREWYRKSENLFFRCMGGLLQCIAGSVTICMKY